MGSDHHQAGRRPAHATRRSASRPAPPPSKPVLVRARGSRAATGPGSLVGGAVEVGEGRSGAGAGTGPVTSTYVCSPGPFPPSMHVRDGSQYQSDNIPSHQPGWLE